jgi:hypothetical protein
MVVQRRHAHPRYLCDLFHPQRLRVVGPHPGDRFCRPLAPISQRSNGSKACSFRAPEDSVDDLALKQVYQPAAGA